MSAVGGACVAPSPTWESFPGFGEGAPLALPTHIKTGDLAHLAQRLKHKTWDHFADALASVGNCAHPISLVGSSTTIDTATGEVLASYSSKDAPLGTVKVPCGNRRAAVCPACSRVYARDTFAMITSGVTGGKTVPEEISDNPLVFATFTAPSFGRVHNSTCGSTHRRDNEARCPHGVPHRCTTTHAADDAALGQPICDRCYDYTSHVVWQWWAPELWRRFTITLKRQLASLLGVSNSKLGEHLSVQFAKVAEYQARGAIHFHALIRLDGPTTKGETPYAPAPQHVTVELLREAVLADVPQVSYTAPPTHEDDEWRTLRFGTQTDVKAVTTTGRPDTAGEALTDAQVAGYLAKYSTKAATDVANTQSNHHYHQLNHTCNVIADAALTREMWRRSSIPTVVPCDPKTDADVYLLMGKWAHQLGFRGHFSTKSRTYSITLGALRRARRRFAAWTAHAKRTGTPLDVTDLERRLLAKDDELDTVLVIGDWTYTGTGWATDLETHIAFEAAGRAREYAQWATKYRTSS